jgi:hypothetical protein
MPQGTRGIGNILCVRHEPMLVIDISCSDCLLSLRKRYSPLGLASIAPADTKVAVPAAVLMGSEALRVQGAHVDGRVAAPYTSVRRWASLASRRGERSYRSRT